MNTDWVKFTCHACGLKTDEGGECICGETLVAGNFDRPAREETHFEKFIKYFHGVKTYQTFPDKKDTGVNARVIHNATPEELLKLNKEGHGIFIAVNETDGKGRKKGNVVKVRAVFADLDGCPLQPCLDDDAHLVVESSPGKYHAYWFVDEKMPLEGFSGVQKAIMERYHSG